MLKNGTLEFYSKIDIVLEYTRWHKEESLEKAIEKNNGNQNGNITYNLPINSKSQAKRLIDLARSLVVNPDLVEDYSVLFSNLITNVDYLIITDNNRWDYRRREGGQPFVPLGPIEGGGDLISVFNHLADWKRRRGLNARVVTVSDIVNGTYGDFTTNARDLQEVVRNFLKWAHMRWGISWLLLGGDIEIIPIRIVAGAAEGYIELRDTNPPQDNKCVWDGSFLKMKVVNPGALWPGSSTDHKLVRPNTGLLIPYDSAGTSSTKTIGWYFTTDDTYNTRSVSPTNYVKVNGPESEIKGTLQWLYQWNTIPTDLYYASLFGRTYEKSGRHDWDLLDNGVYGQHTRERSFDGVVFRTAISVGRAPISTAQQATAFVNKVIAYEQFRRPDGTLLDVTWSRRMLFVSDNWGGRLEIEATATDPPTDDRYHHNSGLPYSLIKLTSPIDDIRWRLFANTSGEDIRMIPYNTNAAATGRGWHFAASESDLSVAEMIIVVAGEIMDRFPIVTNWIVVYGNTEELSPMRYIFDHIELDSSLRDQEELRRQIGREIPYFDTISRLYVDEVDLSLTDAAAAPLGRLTEDRLRNALNLGQHLVSLSGHGSRNGCCWLSRSLARTLNNGYHSCIGYADSCLNSQFDAELIDPEDALGEVIVYTEMGGAVAYVSNTRFSWVGYGDDFQRAFFHQLTSTRHLGLLNDTRWTLANHHRGAEDRDKWQIFALNLSGDPEMQVWRERPPVMEVTIDKTLDKRKPFMVKVEHSLFGESQPLDGAIVSIQQNDRQYQVRTDSEGQANFNVNNIDIGRLDVSVTYDGFVPFIDVIQVDGSK
jgi:hypothetical protein